MRYAILAFIAMLPARAPGDWAERPASWSPDGKWLAYSIRVGERTPGIDTGWIYGPAGSQDVGGDIPTISDEPGALLRLWASRADGGSSVLIDEARGFLIGPSWSPDGRAVAFGRRGDDGKDFEVVVWEGRSRRRLVASRTLPGSKPDLDRVASGGVAWSPDGRYLVVPDAVRPGLAILRVEDGRQVNAIEGGRLPSWSLDGARLACYVPGVEGDSLACLDTPLSRPRLLMEVLRGTRPPTWTRDAILTLAYEGRPGYGRNNSINLSRYRLDSGQVELVQPLSTEARGLPPEQVQGIAVATDRDGEDVFWTSLTKGWESQVVWYRPFEGLIRNRMVVVDPMLPIASITLSPSGGVLAVRFGPPWQPSPPLLFDYDSRGKTPRPIVPDDDARAAWLTLLVDSARAALLGRAAPGPEVARPTLLPLPGDLEPVGELAQRIRRVAILGRPLCDRPADAPAAPPDLAALIDEARLFFDALREDYPSALADLVAFEPRADTPERRLALLGLRAQLAIGLDQNDRAERTLSFLRSTRPRPAPRLEWTGSGPVLTPEDRPAPDWVTSLEARSARLREVARAGPGRTPAVEDHPNQDAMPAEFMGLPFRGPEPVMPFPDAIRFGLPGERPIPPPRPGRLVPPPGPGEVRPIGAKDLR